MACGDTVNPYNVTFTSTETVSEFSTSCFKVELRRGLRLNQVWLWLRVTVRQGSDYIMGQTAKLSTPCKNVTGLPYGTGSNWTVNSQRCSAAVSISAPASLTTVTFAGVASGNHSSKTVKV